MALFTLYGHMWKYLEILWRLDEMGQKIEVDSNVKVKQKRGSVVNVYL